MLRTSAPLIGALGVGIMPSHLISLEGPVEVIDGELTIRIPLDAGGADLLSMTKGIGQVSEDCLVIVIQPWLAEKLRIGEGSMVVVDNRNNKFNIMRSAENDILE